MGVKRNGNVVVKIGWDLVECEGVVYFVFW